MEIASQGFIVATAIIFYSVGAAVYAGLATIIINSLSKAGKIKFLPTFLYSLAGAAIGFFVGIVVFVAFKPKDVSSIDPGLHGRAPDQTNIAIVSVIVQFTIILVVSIISIRTQLRKKPN